MLDWFPLGVKSVEADLDSQVVRILGSTPLKTMTEALEQTGRKARLIGQGIPEGWIFIFAFFFLFFLRFKLVFIFCSLSLQLFHLGLHILYHCYLLHDSVVKD